MQFNDRQSLSESLEGQPEVVPCFLYFVIILNMVALVKPESSAILVIKAPAMRAPIIFPFSKSVRSRILPKYLINLENSEKYTIEWQEKFT